MIQRRVFNRAKDPESEAAWQTSLPVDKLLKDRDEWASDVARSLNGNDTLVGDVSKVYSTSKENLEERIKYYQKHGDAVEGDPSQGDKAETGMVEADRDRKLWRSRRHDTKLGKSAAVLQKSLTAFSRFLEDFSGIAEIAKGADQQYGGIAYGTLLLALSVFVHKTEREEMLDRGFEEIGHTIPRMHTLQKLEMKGFCKNEATRDRLNSLITQNFSYVIVFAREATDYYLSKARRIKDTLRPSIAKNEALVNIRRTSIEIRNECDVLMLEQIAALQSQMYELILTTQRVDQTTLATQQHAVQNHTRLLQSRHLDNKVQLQKLRKILRINEKSLHYDLPGYKKLLWEAFYTDAHHRYRNSHPKELTLGSFTEDDEDFQSWLDKSTSCIMVMGGRNAVEDSPVGSLNWLSHAAVITAEELRSQGHRVAVCLVQTQVWMDSGPPITLQQVICHLIYQIASIHDDALRDQTEVIDGLVQSQNGSIQDIDQMLNSLEQVLVGVFEAFEAQETIYVIVDRLDQTLQQRGDSPGPVPRLWSIVVTLIKVAMKASCRVKFLLVVDHTASKGLIDSKKVLPKIERKVLLFKAEWDQIVEMGRPFDLSRYNTY